MQNIPCSRIQKWVWMVVKQCDIELLLKTLERKEVFSQEEILEYSNALADPLTREFVFYDIIFPGPHALPNIVAALRETDRNNLADLLEWIRIPVWPKLRLFGKEATALPTYSTNSTYRGHVLIINNIHYANEFYEKRSDPEIKRSDPEIDGTRLQVLFEQLGLEVEMHHTLTGTEMVEAILKFRSNQKLKNTAMVFVIFMGQGYYANDLSSISGSDNANITTKWVETQFDNGHCALLQNKPKIFIYRGRRTKMPALFIDPGTEHSRTSTDLIQPAELHIRMVPEAVLKIFEDFSKAQLSPPEDPMQMHSRSQTALRSCSDMLIVYTSLRGDPPHPDMYIEIFCEVIKEHAPAHHLEDMLKAVDFQRARRTPADRTKQTADVIKQGFNQHLYFHHFYYFH